MFGIRINVFHLVSYTVRCAIWPRYVWWCFWLHFCPNVCTIAFMFSRAQAGCTSIMAFPRSSGSPIAFHVEPFHILSLPTLSATCLRSPAIRCLVIPVTMSYFHRFVDNSPSLFPSLMPGLTQVSGPCRCFPMIIVLTVLRKDVFSCATYPSKFGKNVRVVGSSTSKVCGDSPYR